MNTIQMSMLGSHGRFGNCLCQCAFLYTYADRYNLRVEVSRFPGQERLPNLNFEPISQQLPPWHERTVDPDDRQSQQIPPVGDECVNRDFRGYGQYKTGYYAPHKDLIQQMWRPSTTTEQEQQLQEVFHDVTSIGIHYRAGDYVTVHHNQTSSFRPPKLWYTNWLEDNLNRFNKPQLFVAVEEPQYLEWFKPYRPLTATDIGLSNHFVDEWLMLSRCDVILMPNSTYSFTAAMANPNLKEAWRASLPAGAFAKLDVWDEHPMSFEKGRDYPHLQLDRIE